MNNIVVRVENLGYAPRGKRYQLGAAKSGSFRESLTRAFRRSKTGSRSLEVLNPDSAFWALQDINFEIKRRIHEGGEADSAVHVGIIGRNGDASVGAGKSTLLKILSRITEPTKPIGRENVYLNVISNGGNILGTKCCKVESKSDRISQTKGVNV